MHPGPITVFVRHLGFKDDWHRVSVPKFFVYKSPVQKLPGKRGEKDEISGYNENPEPAVQVRESFWEGWTLEGIILY